MGWRLDEFRRYLDVIGKIHRAILQGCEEFNPEGLQRSGDDRMRYRDLPYEEKKKIVSLVFEETNKMKRSNMHINCHELSRMILMKTGIYLAPSTIWDWFAGRHTPLRRRHKAVRRPPDENAQVVRGLVLTDLDVFNTYNTTRLFLTTTKDFYAYSTRRLLSKYGWVTVKPLLSCSTPEWRMSAYIDYSRWIHELRKPINFLTKREKMKLLSGAISGDGYITISYVKQKYIGFAVALSSTQKHKAKIFHQVLESLEIPHRQYRIQRGVKWTRIGDQIVWTRSPYEYRIIVESKNAIKCLLMNLRLIEPFREIKRLLVLRFIEKGLFDRDLVKPVWDYLRTLEKYSTIRSQIRACKLISEEEFDKKNLDKQRILKRLHGRLYEYADMVEKLKPAAMKIISDLRSTP